MTPYDCNCFWNYITEHSDEFIQRKINLFHHHDCLHFFPFWIFGNSFPVPLCPFGPHGLFVLQCCIICFNAQILSISVNFKLKLVWWTMMQCWYNTCNEMGMKIKPMHVLIKAQAKTEVYPWHVIKLKGLCTCKHTKLHSVVIYPWLLWCSTSRSGDLVFFFKLWGYILPRWSLTQKAVAVLC